MQTTGVFTLRYFSGITHIWLCIHQPLLLTGAITLQPINPFDEVERPTAIEHLLCRGDEIYLTDCAVNTEVVENCGQYEVAGVACLGKCMELYMVLYSIIKHIQVDAITQNADCGHGSVRLVGHDEEGYRQGRVELCVNNVWGTICNTQFNQEDANVVCAQLDGFYREGLCS